jgi:hypothetical protein
VPGDIVEGHGGVVRQVRAGTGGVGGGGLVVVKVAIAIRVEMGVKGSIHRGGHRFSGRIWRPSCGCCSRWV